MKILLILALALPIPRFPDAQMSRSICTHGCHSKYCKKANCGDTCKMGPACRGCWKYP
jgi:hypothetical protein